jgi:thymidylate kinase
MDRFIVVEGCDGVGKSTIVATLANRLGYVAVKTPSQDFIERRAPFDEPGILPRTRFDFYADGVRASSKEILALLECKDGVVVDRYLTSLIVYHSTLDSETDYAALVTDMNFPREDIQIVLYADMDILYSRIDSRYDKRSDAHLEQNCEFMNQISTRFLNLDTRNCAKTVYIDSGLHSVDEVVEQCLRHVR